MSTKAIDPNPLQKPKLKFRLSEPLPTGKEVLWAMEADMLMGKVPDLGFQGMPVPTFSKSPVAEALLDLVRQRRKYDVTNWVMKEMKMKKLEQFNEL